MKTTYNVYIIFTTTVKIVVILQHLQKKSKSILRLMVHFESETCLDLLDFSTDPYQSKIKCSIEMTSQCLYYNN